VTFPCVHILYPYLVHSYPPQSNFLFFFTVLRIKPRALPIVGKRLNTDFHTKPSLLKVLRLTVTMCCTVSLNEGAALNLLGAILKSQWSVWIPLFYQVKSTRDLSL
jgi:hypothetical protein